MCPEGACFVYRLVLRWETVTLLPCDEEKQKWWLARWLARGDRCEVRGGSRVAVVGGVKLVSRNAGKSGVRWVLGCVLGLRLLETFSGLVETSLVARREAPVGARLGIFATTTA